MTASAERRAGRGRLRRVCGVLACVALVAIPPLNSRCVVRLDDAQRERWAHAWIEALNRREWVSLGPLLAPGVSYSDSLAPGRLSAHWTAIHLATLWRRYPDIEFRRLGVGGEDGALIVEFSADGLRPGPVRGVFFLEIGCDKVIAVRGSFAGYKPPV